MKIDDISRIGVIGTGLMGAQIAEAFARIGGYEVYIVDLNNELVSNGLKNINDRLERFFVSKGKLTIKEKDLIMKRIKGSTKMEEALQEVNFVIEAIPEKLELKKAIFKKLSEITPQNAVLSSNTSYLNITEMSLSCNRPDKVIGMHFFNPVAVMRLVEVVKGSFSSKETTTLVCDLAKKLGKEPIVCTDLSYGFLANRIYAPLRYEAVQMVWERVATPEDIDKAAKLGYNLPMGPLELGDLIGSWGIIASSEQDKINELGSEKGRIHPLVRAMVRAGYIGGQGKKGIYDYWKEVLNK